MACDDLVVFVDDDRVEETKVGDALSYLAHLMFGMGAGVMAIRSEVPDGNTDNYELTSISACYVSSGPWLGLELMI